MRCNTTGGASEQIDCTKRKEQSVIRFTVIVQTNDIYSWMAVKYVDSLLYGCEKKIRLVGSVQTVNIDYDFHTRDRKKR